MTDSEFIKVYQKYRNNVYSVIYHYVRNEYEEYSVRQIAQLLGMMEATVKTRLNRGRTLLKTKIERVV